jgi:hypothetical protein
MNTNQRMIQASSNVRTGKVAKPLVHRAIVLGLMSGALIALGVVLELAALNYVQVRLEGPWLLSLLFSAGRDALVLLLGTSDRVWLQLAPLALGGSGVMMAMAAHITASQSRLMLSGLSLVKRTGRDAER